MSFIGSLELLELFKNAPRMGSGVDIPEGSRYIQVSDTLAKEIVESLSDVTPLPTNGGIT